MALVQHAPGLRVSATSQELRLDRYDPDAFTALPELKSAGSRFKCLEKKAPTRSIRRIACTDWYERLVEYWETSVPWQHDQLYKEIVPSTWLICHNGAIRPYGFIYAPQHEIEDADPDPDPISPDKARFLQAFQRLLQKHNAIGLFGLCRYPGDDFRGRIEITQGPANINFLYGDISMKCLYCASSELIVGA